MSGTIADKLNLLANTKESIRQAIIAKSVSVAESDKFADYPSKIAQISGGGAQTVISAENATGADITVDDKVWVHNISTTAGAYGFIDTASQTTSYGGARIPVMDALGYYVGHFKVSAGKMYFVRGVNDYVPYNTVYTSNIYAQIAFYAADGGAVVMHSKNYVSKFGGKYASSTNNSTNNGYIWMWPVLSNDATKFYHTAGISLYSENPDDFSDSYTSVELEGFTDNGYSNCASGGYIIGEYFYHLWNGGAGTASGASYRWNINTGARESFTSNNFQNGRYCLGITNDNKYIFWSPDEKASFTAYQWTPTVGLRMIEQSEASRTYLAKSEMPAVLQDWYDIDCFKLFNPLNQVLTLAEYDSSTPRYGFYQYQNGEWVDLQISLDGLLPEEKYFTTGICIDRDLKRVRIQYASSKNSSNGSTDRVAEVKTSTGYQAIKYAFGDEHTITGRADSAGTAGNNFDAEVILI